MNGKSEDLIGGFIEMLLTHPRGKEDVIIFITELFHQALACPEIQTEVVEAILEDTVASMHPLVEPPKEETKSVLGRQQITAREAAGILRYHHRYFTRKAKAWGLTKIKMSRTSARYYLDEVEQLARDRGIKNRY